MTAFCKKKGAHVLLHKRHCFLKTKRRSTNGTPLLSSAIKLHYKRIFVNQISVIPKICTFGATKGLNRTNANKFLIDFIRKAKDPQTQCLRAFWTWRSRWDSNPRGLAPKRFSRPPRYDRFDTAPCGANYNRMPKQFQILYLLMNTAVSQAILPSLM